MVKDPRRGERREEPSEGAPERRVGERREGERRGSVRVSLDLGVRQEGDNFVVFNRAVDLSIGGMQLSPAIPYPAGQMLQLRFTLPTDDESEPPVELRARVVESVGVDDLPHTHLQFLDVDEATRARLIHLLTTVELRF